MKKEFKLGLFIGKFLPPHLGHIKTILKCSKRCERLFVIVADSEARSKRLCELSNISYVSPAQRAAWLEQIFKRKRNISIVRLDQGMLEAFPDNIPEWRKKLFSVAGTTDFVWFVDNNFLDISHKVFPDVRFVGFDRSIINISATEIRNAQKINSKFLPRVVYEHFKNNNKTQN